MWGNQTFLTWRLKQTTTPIPQTFTCCVKWKWKINPFYLQWKTCRMFMSHFNKITGSFEFAGRKTSLKVVTRPRLPVRSVLLTAVRKHLWTDLMSLIQISTQALLLWGPVHIVLLKCTNQEHEVQWFLSTWWDEYSASLMTEKQETGAERFCGVFYSCTSAVSYFLKYRLKTLCTRYVNL